jgi:hypothetical protein
VFSGGVSFPVINFTNVVLPVPECPVSTKKSFISNDKFKFLNKGLGLSRYHRLRFLISINGVVFSMDEMLNGKCLMLDA